MRARVDVQERLSRFVSARWVPDLGGLSAGERRVVDLLTVAADGMEIPFWIQNSCDPDQLIPTISDPRLRRYVRMNCGPWDRAHGDEPIMEGYGSKPAGTNYYSHDITTEELEAAARSDAALTSPFTMVRRDRRGRLIAIPYHDFFLEHLEPSVAALRQAARATVDDDLGRFLEQRAQAMLTDEYQASDGAWVAM
jgi:hypothetical protein